MMINLRAKVVKKHQSRNKKLSSPTKNVFLGNKKLNDGFLLPTYQNR